MQVKLLMRAHHRNVVSFIGYSYDGKTMALVFEYVANGNLRQHLTFSGMHLSYFIYIYDVLALLDDHAKMQ